MKVLKFTAVLLLAVGMFSTTAVANNPEDVCATADSVAPLTADPCADKTPTGPLSGAGDCGGVSPITGGGVLDQWVSFVATATAHNVTTNLNSTGTDSNFVVWDACPPAGNKIGCGEDLDYTPGQYNFLSETCVGGLTIGATYYVQVGTWADGCPNGPYVVDIGAAAGGVCGDGTISCVPAGNQGAEACDPPDGLHCDASCQWVCGDGVVQSGEECDPPGPCCSATCLFVVICGNGCIEGTEQCDDGNTTNLDGCDSNCQIEGPRCGDNNVDAGEECDGTGIPLCAAGSYCATNCRCVQGIPAVSEWGLAVLLLIGLVSGTILFGRRRVAVH